MKGYSDQGVEENKRWDRESKKKKKKMNMRGRYWEKRGPQDTVCLFGVEPTL